MGLLNNRDFDLSAFDGSFGPLLFRSPLQGDAQAPDGFGAVPVAASDASQAANAFDGAAMPFSFAGPGSLNFNPPIDPAIQNLQPVSALAAPNQQPAQSDVRPTDGAHPRANTLGEALVQLWEHPPRNGLVHILQSGGRAVRDMIEAANVLEALRNMPPPNTEEEAAAQNDLRDRANSQIINSSAVAAMRFGPMTPGAALALPISRAAARIAPLAVLGAASTFQKPEASPSADH